jgi:CDP-glycerol glycerophosphotransferase (TagB/SpsB family)
MHPQDKRIIRKGSVQFEYSNSNEESAFNFLSKIDLLISGDSSIHLEAALLHIPSIIYGFNKKNLIGDYYEYAKNGLVHHAQDDQEIVSKIETNDFNLNFDILKYYNAVSGTKWEGRSKELIIQTLKEFIF